METKIIPMPTQQVAEKKVAATYTFREITDTVELEKAFRLRYDANVRNSNTGFPGSGPDIIDIEVIDFHSRHYCIVKENGEMEAVIRVVLGKTSFCNETVLEIARKFHVLPEPMNAYREFILAAIGDYPFHTYSAASKNANSHYQQLISKNSGFAEACRLAPKEDNCNSDLSSFTMDCIMALFHPSCQGKMFAVLCSEAHHRLFAEKYGFRPFGDTHYNTCDSAGKLSMYLYPRVLPEHLAMKLQGISAEYLFTNKITKTL